MTPRKVKLSTKLSLLKKRPIPILIGVLFTLIPLFIVFVLSIVFSSIKKDAPKIDYELVNSQGNKTFAEVTNIVTQYNITINGIHPTTISYKFSNNGKNIESKNEVLEDRKIEKLEVGDTLKIKQLNDVSIISDFEPYEFPTNDILYFPIPLLFIGLPFLFFSFIKLNKEVELYKFGTELKGKIISMMPKSGIPISNIGQGIIVHYEYKTTNGERIIAESFSNDFSILSDKKKDDFIPIFISNKNEKKSCIVPKLESLKNGWNIDFD